MFTNFFQDKQPKTPIQANTQTQLGASLPQFYQVQPGDTGMDQVAANNGFQLPDVVNANDGVKSLPPSGSYIQLPRSGFDQAPQQQANTNTAMQGYRTGEQQLYGAAGIPGTSNADRGNPGAPMMREIMLGIQNQIAQGQAPNAVPASMLAALGATPESMTAAGYVFNSQTGTYALPGTNGVVGPGPVGGGGGGVNPNAGKIYYSKSRGFVTREVAGLLNKRRRRHAAEGNRLANERAAAAAAAATPGATVEGPSTVLDLNLGSG